MVTVPATALIYGLVAWINTTGLIEPVIPTSPLILNVTDSAGVADDIVRCYIEKGVETPDYERALEYAGTLNGLYCLDRITLHADKVDLSTPGGQTVLVHELVHWLQDYNGEAEAAPCVPHLERNAYAVHHQWQATMGLPIYPDPFTIHIRSQCPTGVKR